MLQPASGDVAPTARPDDVLPSAAPLHDRRALVVEDEDSVRRVLASFLRSLDFDVVAVDSGAAALEALASRHFVLMLCDLRMPGLSGMEVVSRALELNADLAIMMLTAVNDAPTATEALSRGALDYVVKPFHLNDLGRLVERALHRRSLMLERRRVERLIREEVAQRTAELERGQAALRALTVSVAEALINALEAKDVYLRGHSQRVAALAAAIAEQMGLGADAVEQVRLAGRLHDVGKIGTHEAVLNKPGPLSAEEFAHVQEHVERGVEILAPLVHLGDALVFVRDHHEHWDGTGYPRGLRGTAISLGGRILCAADAYDALTSRRAWREPLSPEETILFLESHAGTLLDPEVFDALRLVVGRRRTLVFLDG